MTTAPRTRLTVLLAGRPGAGDGLRDAHWHRLSSDCAVAMPGDTHESACRGTGNWDPCAQVDPLIALLRHLQSDRIVLDLSGHPSPSAVMADVLQDDVLGPLLRLDGVLCVNRSGPTGRRHDLHRSIADRSIAAEALRSIEDLPGTGLKDARTGELQPERWLPMCEARELRHYALRRREFFEWLTDVRSILGEACLRLKAIIGFQDATDAFAFHALHGRFQSPVLLPDGAGTASQSRIQVVAEPANRRAADRCIDRLEALGSTQPMRPPSTIRLVAVQ